MRRALQLAEARLGRVWPNPAVGCVLAHGDEVVGEGATGLGGRPHGEAVALQMAQGRAAGATAYVTLEPCSHWGRTPPCTEALIHAGVRRVVVAMVDPDPRVNGTGLAQLELANIQLEVGLLEAEAARINLGFLTRVRSGRPYVVIGSEPDRFDAVLRAAAGRPDAVEVCVAYPSVGPPRLWVAPRGVPAPDGASHLPVIGPPTPEAAVLAALGEHGLTRALVFPNDPVAERLRRAGLVDDELPSNVPDDPSTSGR